MNNMDPMAVPEILSNMSDAEQMLIARLAPTVHVHLPVSYTHLTLPTIYSV